MRRWEICSVELAASANPASVSSFLSLGRSIAVMVMETRFAVQNLMIVHRYPKIIIYHT